MNCLKLETEALATGIQNNIVVNLGKKPLASASFLKVGHIFTSFKFTVWPACLPTYRTLELHETFSFSCKKHFSFSASFLF